MSITSGGRGEKRAIYVINSPREPEVIDIFSFLLAAKTNCDCYRYNNFMPGRKIKLKILAGFPRVLFNLWTNRPVALSFDISGACNLNCPYCYWQKSQRRAQLPLDQIVEIAKKYRRQGIIHATLIGGEPTLRPDVLQVVTPIFPINWVVTNGIPVKHPQFPDFDLFSLPNTWVIVSLDGVGKVHDNSRQHPGLYSIIKERFWGKPILTTTTIHQANRDQPEKLLKEWSRSGILGMTFEFATPVGRAPDSRFDLVGSDRDAVIDRLIELKRIYGRFMANSIAGLNLLRSQNLKSWTGPARCPAARFTVSLDELGQRKYPCVLGSAIDNPNGQKPACGSCGCHVPTILTGFKYLDWQTIDSALWFLRDKNKMLNKTKSAEEIRTDIEAVE